MTLNMIDRKRNLEQRNCRRCLRGEVIVSILLLVFMFGGLPEAVARKSKSEVVVDALGIKGDEHAGEKKIIGYALLTFNPKFEEETFPLLVVFHGRGVSSPACLNKWRYDAAENRVMVLAPSWDRAATNAKLEYGDFEFLLEHITKRYPVDKNRIYIAGTSAGATVAREFAMNNIKYWRTVIFVSSPTDEWWAGDWEVIPETFPPILYVHGQQDPQFDYELIRERVRALTKLGFDAELISDPSGTHQHDPLWNEEIFEWLEQKE